MQVFFDDEIFQQEVHGGVSRYICELAGALGATGEIRVIIFGGLSKNGFLRALSEGPGLKKIFLPRPPRLRINRLARRLAVPWRRAAFCQALREDAGTIYHPSLFQFDPALRALAPAMVVTVHDMTSDVLLDNEASRRVSAACASAVKAADRILCVSESTARDLARVHPETVAKIRVAHLASNLQAEDTLAAAAAQTEGAYFLVVGQRHTYKRGELIMRAFARVRRREPRLRLVLCGGPPPSAEELALAGDGVAARNVSWMQADDRILARLYAGALALVYPSDYEGFGLPPLEAMRCGCPVITSRSSSMPEVMGAAALLIAPGDLDGLAAQMESVLRDEALRQALRERGRKRAELFSWERTAKLTLEVFRVALGQAGSSI